jgi:hypothetical protein
MSSYSGPQPLHPLPTRSAMVLQKRRTFYGPASKFLYGSWPEFETSRGAGDPNEMTARLGRSVG